MNEKLLDTLFTRRKETITSLALCLAISSLLAIASRIPALFVSLPASWISGGLSIAFIWAIGPVIILLFQAYALQSLAETEQIRKLLNSRSRTELQETATKSTSYREEITPIWKQDFPVLIHTAMALVLVAPFLADLVLFSSYLNFVRPANPQDQWTCSSMPSAPDTARVASVNAQKHWKYCSRSKQLADAFLGIGNWRWFKPLAPSLQDNLNLLASRATNPSDKEKYHSLADEIPWVWFPIQTWAYLLALAISGSGALAGWDYMAGKERFALFRKRRRRRVSTPS